ncbi:MAG: hypothetical protein ACO3EE_03620 [Flavobacteriales bacterium]
MRKIAFIVLFIASALSANAQGKFIIDAALAYSASDFIGAQKSLHKAWDVILQKQALGEKVKDFGKYYKLKVQVYVRLADLYNREDSALVYADTAKNAAYEYYKVDASKYYDAEVKDGMLQLTFYYQNIGVFYYQKEEYTKAFSSFANVIDLQKFVQPEKNDLSAYHNAAFASLYAKEYKKSLPYFSILIDSNYTKQKSLIEYKRSIIRVNLELGDTTSALTKLKEYNTGDTIIEFLKEEVSILLAQNKQKEALARMQLLVDKKLNDPIIYENIAKIYQQMGEYELSRKFYNEVLKLDNDRADSHYGLGAVLVIESNRLMGEKQRAKLNEAIPELEMARKLSPNDSDTLKALFQIYNNLGLSDKAAEIKAILSK